MSRYIDADNLVNAKILSIHTRYVDGWNDAIDAIIECEPTADVQENVHGEWLNDKNESVEMIDGVPQETCWCSNCKEWLTASDEYECYGNYCPKCGADMRKGEKMARYIDADAVEKIINDIRDCISVEGYWAILQRLERIPTAQQWIPVSERLPHAEYGESDNVLVTCESKCIRLLYFDGGNWCYPTGECYEHRIDKVIAWMPLPKPYEAPAPERDCEHCVHRKDKGCEKWDCEFERRTE